MAGGNNFLQLSYTFFKESFIPISGNAFSSPKEQYCFLFRAFFPAGENYREAYWLFKTLITAISNHSSIFLDIRVNGSSFPSNRNVFLNKFSIPANGNRFSL